MNLITRFIKAFSWYPASGGAEVFGRGIPGATRISYNSREAESSTIIAAGLRWACMNSIEPPLLVARSANNELVPIPEHALSRLIAAPLGSVDTGRSTTSMMLRMGVMAGLFLDGNAYLIKVRSASGAVIGLDWVAHTSVQVKLASDTESIESYVVNRLGMVSSYDPGDVVHLRWLPDFDNPFMGSSPLKNCMRQILTDNQIAVYTHALLRSPWPSALISPANEGQAWNRPEMETLLAEFRRQASGERAGNMMGLTSTAKVDKLSMTPKEMDIAIMARLGEERLTAAMGIPAIVIGLGAGLDRATFSNYAEARQSATEDFLVPMWTIISSTLNEQLLPEFKGVAGVQFTHDTSGVRALQDDRDALYKRITDTFGANIINRAEARRALGFAPGKGDDGIYAWMLAPNAMVGPVQSKALRAELEGLLRDAG